MAKDNDDNLLQDPTYVSQIINFWRINILLRDSEYVSIERQPSYYSPLHTLKLAKGDQKHYQQQYADMYFLRLAMLKPSVEEIAAEAWEGAEVAILRVRRKR